MALCFCMDLRRACQDAAGCSELHPVSITRFPLRRFSPGAGLLRNPFVRRWWLRFSRGWVRKDGNLLRETGPTDRYTQFAIQDSRLFGPNPWKALAPPSNYLSKKGFWATQPLEQILDSEFLLCELGVAGTSNNMFCYMASKHAVVYGFET